MEMGNTELMLKHRLHHPQEEACHSWQPTCSGEHLRASWGALPGRPAQADSDPRVLISCPTADLFWGQLAVSSSSPLGETPPAYAQGDSSPVHFPKAAPFSLACCHCVGNENSSYRIWCIKQSSFTGESNMKWFYFPTATAFSSAMFIDAVPSPPPNPIPWEQLRQILRFPSLSEIKSPVQSNGV